MSVITPGVVIGFIKLAVKLIDGGVDVVLGVMERRSTHTLGLKLSPEEYDEMAGEIDEFCTNIWYDEDEGILYMEREGKPIERWTCGKRLRKARRTIRGLRAEIRRLKRKP